MSAPTQGASVTNAKLHNNAYAFLLKGLTISVKCTASLHPFAKDANDVALYSRVGIEGVLYKRARYKLTHPIHNNGYLKVMNR